jgi:hypothetical protein
MEEVSGYIQMTEEYGNIPDGFHLSDKEVEDLRKSKKELTEYGKQKLRELMDKDLIFKTNGKETSRMTGQFTLEDLTIGTKAPETKLEIKMTEPYPDEMFELAEKREAERKALDALDKLYEENGNAMTKLAEIEEEEFGQLAYVKRWEQEEETRKLAAGYKKKENGEWYRPTLEELTRNERIELAEKEIAYMVMGGQDGREYADSIAFLLQVLDSLRDKEDTEWKDSADGVA